MTREEAASVMAVITAAYPRVRLVPEALEVWYEAALAGTEHEVGLRIAMDLVARPDSKGEFPSPAQFNEVKRQHSQREAMASPPPADEWEPLPNAQAQEWFAKMRETLGRPKDTTTP